MTGLLEALDGDPRVDRVVDDRALVAAMLAVETAHVRVTAPAEADGVARAARALAELVDVDELGRRSLAAGNPVVPLVADLLEAVPAQARGHVHAGLTSQDVLDTALVLLARDALDVVVPSLHRAADAAARLADEHRGTLAVARTLGQPALPTTFGLRAAGWCAGLDAAASWLDRVRRETLAVQVGGAAGTLSALPGGAATVAAMAVELGLPDPGVAWHTERWRLHELAAALASATAASAKVASDVVGLSAAEVAEVSEGGDASHGGSSAMPQKRNPVTSLLVLAAARRTPGLLSSVLAAGVHEQERATGSWHAEWQPVRSLLRLAGGAAARTADVLEGLVVDPVAMRANLDAACPGVLAERVSSALLTLGRARAQAVVKQALAGSAGDTRRFADALLAEPGTGLDAATLERLLDPAGAVGEASGIVDRVLARRGRRHE